MTTRWLSYPMSVTAPRPPAIPAPQITEYMSIAGTGANVQFLQVYNHTGTHLDAAAHVLEGGASINDFTPTDLIFTKVLVLDLTGTPDDTVVTPALLTGLDRGSDAQALVVRFGVADIRKNDPKRFSAHCPGFCQESAAYIHHKMPHLRMIGTDVPSIACINSLEQTMACHNVFFEKASLEKFIIIEEMKLNEPLEGIARLLVSPWMVEGMNSGPCVIWAEYQS